VAVVQISRIQIRRGKKNSGTGLPQLASGELGWAVDSQELFIGNGAVSEGAPYVGNTKLLSEHDNLFEFADTYQYKSGTNIQTGNSANEPVLRTLQERLDDRVSVRSFGASGDGTDQTAALQRAIDQLYLNASNKGTPQARVELILEPGEYTISSTIYLPPYATLRGAGADKTIINAGNHIAFQTVNETSTPGSYASDAVSTTLNQARNISMSGMTINGQHTGIVLQSCKDSYFEDLIISGSWNLGNSVNANSVGIKLNSLSTAVTSQNNIFKDIYVKNKTYAVYSDWDIRENSWHECRFEILHKGFVFGENTVLGIGGQLTGPQKNIISHSVFDDIEQQAIQVLAGPNNTSESNKYLNVGNNGGTDDLNEAPIIQYDDQGCISSNDYFQRSEFLGYDAAYLVNVPYITEIKGDIISQLGTPHTISIGESGSPIKLFKLPAADNGKGYEIDYIYKSNSVTAMRSGTLKLAVDPTNDAHLLSDEYEYLGDGAYQESLVFQADNYDENGDGTVDTIAVMMLNSTSGDEATLTYTVKYKS
jgi:hypothetical protein